MNSKILFFFLAILLISSCQDVIDLKVPDGDLHLVVDGWLTDQEGEKQVLLTQTANYFDSTAAPKVTGALVSLKNETGVVEVLKEKEPGVYVMEHVGQVGSTYQLYIQTAEGEEYESKPELLRAAPPIENISYKFKEKTAFEDEGYYVSIDTYEPLGVGDHYRWKQYVNGEYLSEPFDLLYASDEFVDGNPIIGFEVNLEPLELNDHYRVEQLSISEDAYNFFFQLQQQTAFVGSLFDSPPAALEGNIERIDGKSGPKALGFFGVSALRSKEIVIEE